MNTRVVGVVSVVMLGMALVGCTGSSDILEPTSQKNVSPSASPARTEAAGNDGGRAVAPFTVFDTCGLNPVRRPDNLALACGDAGLQLANIRYDHYGDSRASGRAEVLVVPRPGTKPEDIGRRRFPVEFTVDHPRVRRGQPLFTRLHLRYVDGVPDGAQRLYLLPMYGPDASDAVPASVGPFLAFGGDECLPGQLETPRTKWSGAGGWIVSAVIVRNVGHHPCALRGPVEFRGLDAAGNTITSVTTCDGMITRHDACSAPVVLFPTKQAHSKKRPTESFTRLYGWGRGRHRDWCLEAHKVTPVTMQIQFGELTVTTPNARGERAMWGCGDVGIATGSH